jgi:hypothetical protein
MTWLLALLVALLAAFGVDPCVAEGPEGVCVPASQAG